MSNLGLSTVGSSTSSRPSSSTQAQKNYDLLVSFESNLSEHHRYWQPSANLKILTHKIFGSGLNSVLNNPNSNLLALSYVFLVVAFRNQSGNRLKTAMLEEISTLADSFASLCSYPNENIVKSSKLQSLLNYMLRNLHLHNPSLGIFELLDKFYPSLQLLSLFFRAVLINLNYPGSKSYEQSLSTSEVYAILTEYFDLSCNATDHVYFFQDDGLFIASKDQNQFVFGRYYQNQTQLHQNQKQIRKSTLDYLGELNGRCSNLKISTDLAMSISGFIFPNEDIPYFSSNVPTPEFGENQTLEKLELKTSGKNTKPELEQGESPPDLKLLNSFGNCNFQFRSDILESELAYSRLNFERQTQAFGEENYRNMGQAAGESLSLRDISYRKCDSDRGDPEEKKNQEPEKNSQISITINGKKNKKQGMIESSSFSKTPKKTFQKHETLSPVSQSWFQEHPRSEIGYKGNDKVSSPESIFSCICSEAKLSKMTLSSNVLSLAYQPQNQTPNFKKKKKAQKSSKAKKLTLKRKDLLETLKGKDKCIKTYRSENRIDGFVKRKMPSFLKNRKREISKSCEKSNRSRSKSFQKKSLNYQKIRKTANIRSHPSISQTQSQNFSPSTNLFSSNTHLSTQTVSTKYSRIYKQKVYLNEIFAQRF